jgi:hypothetical protein
MNRPRRKRGGAYNFPALRRREIERHARDVGAAHTEDFWRWIVGWRWHNEQNSRDPAGALILAAKRMGGSLTEAGAERILETADALPRCCTADKLGKFLGVTYAQRQRLAITTIGSIDVNKRSRALLRKRKNRLHNERKRRAQGIRPRAAYKENSLMHIKPWEAEGISRRTWYRRKRGTGPSPPRRKASADAPGIAGSVAQVRHHPFLPLKTAAQMAQVRQQPSYLSLLTHLCHRRESKAAAEGELALSTRC